MRVLKRNRIEGEERSMHVRLRCEARGEAGPAIGLTHTLLLRSRKHGAAGDRGGGGTSGDGGWEEKILAMTASCLQYEAGVLKERDRETAVERRDWETN